MVTSLCVFALLMSAQADPIDLKTAASYFTEAKQLSQQDNGALWGVPLYGPMLFVDRATRFAVANQADKEDRLTARGDVFVGTLPDSLGLANTSVEWAGVTWTMVLWPLPDDPQVRAALMLHECFHRVQDKIGIPGSDPPNGHLAEEDGRVWMQLEWRALARALTSKGDACKGAINDALLFRAARRNRYPDAAVNETKLERHEGLAEYTGQRLCGRSAASARRYAADKLQQAEQNKSFVRSFAYATGPAYGLLLDEFGGDWRSQAKKGAGLSELLAKAVGDKPAADLSLAAKRGDAYDGEALRASEHQRAIEHAKLIANYRKTLVDGPVLRLPLRHPNITFDPRTPVVLKGLGTVYPGLELRDEWGTLHVERGGALVFQDWSAVHVAAPNGPDASKPDSTKLSGDGWSVQLNDGWRLTAGERQGDKTLTSD